MTNQKQILWKENVKYELVYEWLNRDVSLGRNLRLMHAVLLRRAEPSSLLLEYDVSQLSVELAEGRYISLSVIISRVFQR